MNHIKKIAIVLFIIIYQNNDNVLSQTLKSLNRVFEYDDPNNDPNWDWTINKEYTIYYKNEDIVGSVNYISTKLPYFSIYGPASKLNVVYEKLDIFPQDGWVFINKDFGTPTDAPSIPYFTLYNKTKGLLRFFFLQTKYPEAFSYAAVRLFHKKNSSIQASGTLCLSDSENQFLDKKNSDFEQVSITSIESMEWSYADFEILSYDPNIPDYSEYSIQLFGVKETDFNAGFEVVKDEEEVSSSTFQSISKSIVEGTDQATKYFNSFENFQNSIEKKAKKDTASWYSGFLQDIAKNKLIDAAPLFGIVAGYVSSYIGDEKGVSVSIFDDVTLKGKLKSELNLYTLSLQVPGAKHGRFDNSLPAYDKPMGIIGIYEPTVDCYYAVDRNGYKANYSCRISLNDFEYVLNNCIEGVEVQDIELGWVWGDRSVEYFDIQTFRNKTFDCFTVKDKYSGYEGHFYNVFFKNKNLFPKLSLKMLIKNEAKKNSFVTVIKVLNPKFKFVSPNEWPEVNDDVIIDYNYEMGYLLYMEPSLKSSNVLDIEDEIVTTGNVIMGGYGNTVIVRYNGIVNVVAGGNSSIILKSGFKAERGCHFNAKLYSEFSDRNLLLKRSEICPYEYNLKNSSVTNMNTNEVELESKSSNEFKINMYPNPSNGNLTVVFPYNDKWKIEIYNSLGKVIKNDIVFKDNARIFIREKGFYIIKTYNNYILFERKVLIK